MFVTYLDLINVLLYVQTTNEQRGSKMSRVQIQILLSNYFINNKKIAIIKFESKT